MEFSQGFSKLFHVLTIVIYVKTGPGRGLDSECLVGGLSTVMACSDGNSVFCVEPGRELVRESSLHVERKDADSALCGLGALDYQVLYFL